MARPTKSYAELQRQHITSDLRQRQAVTRRAAENASQTASDDVATATSVVEAGIFER